MANLGLTIRQDKFHMRNMDLYNHQILPIRHPKTSPVVKGYLFFFHRIWPSNSWDFNGMLGEDGDFFMFFFGWGATPDDIVYITWAEVRWSVQEMLVERWDSHRFANTEPGFLEEHIAVGNSPWFGFAWVSSFSHCGFPLHLCTFAPLFEFHSSSHQVPITCWLQGPCWTVSHGGAHPHLTSI